MRGLILIASLVMIFALGVLTVIVGIAAATALSLITLAIVAFVGIGLFGSLLELRPPHDK